MNLLLLIDGLDWMYDSFKSLNYVKIPGGDSVEKHVFYILLQAFLIFLIYIL